MRKNAKNGATVKVAATIILHEPCNYSAEGMRAIAAWAKRVLRDVAKHRNAGQLGKRFAARYHYAT